MEFKFERDEERERAMAARLGPGVMMREPTAEDVALLDGLLQDTLTAFYETAKRRLPNETVSLHMLGLWLSNMVGIIGAQFLSSAPAEARPAGWRLIELNVVAQCRQRAADGRAEAEWGGKL